MKGCAECKHIANFCLCCCLAQVHSPHKYKQTHTDTHIQTLSVSEYAFWGQQVPRHYRIDITMCSSCSICCYCCAYCCTWHIAGNSYFELNLLSCLLLHIVACKLQLLVATVTAIQIPWMQRQFDELLKCCHVAATIARVLLIIHIVISFTISQI